MTRQFATVDQILEALNKQDKRQIRVFVSSPQVEISFTLATSFSKVFFRFLEEGLFYLFWICQAKSCCVSPKMAASKNTSGCFFTWLKTRRFGCVGITEKLVMALSRTAVAWKTLFSHSQCYQITAQYANLV